MLKHIRFSSTTSISLVVSILSTFLGGVYGQRSPCPSVFEYSYDGYKSYGIVKLPAVNGANNLQIKIAFDGLPDPVSSRGDVSLLDSNNEVIEKLQTGGHIRYKIDFPNGITSIPDLLSIKLNNQEYCDNSQGSTFKTRLTISFNLGIASPGSSSNVPPSTSKKPPRKPTGDLTINYDTQSILRPNDFHTINSPTSSSTGLLNRVQDEWLNNFRFNSICGTKDASVIHTVIHGMHITPNEFPWLVALFDDKRKYFCGGSLVSDKHVVSAAHCTIDKSWLWLELGKHELDNRNEEGVVVRFPESIVNHPNYVANTGHADISIIILSEKVSFSNKIKPICIWPFYAHREGLKGTVAGWGTDISGEGTNTPMSVLLDIVSNDECKKSDRIFSTIISEDTFCAGGKNKGPCLGDSGSGFIVQRNNRWYLKGIISTSIKAGYNSCNVGKYAVYCDVGKNIDWLKNYLL